MRTAIDRLNIGEEKEIDILEFDGNRQKNRFVCPECGEYVDVAFGDHKKYFKHPKGKGADCELRVDNSSQFTFFQRVGLPIYLMKNANDFKLYIGFYGLGHQVLEDAKKISLKVIIGSDAFNQNENLYYNIDNYNFFENDITFIELNFIPKYNKDYKISFSDNNSNISKLILKKWSDFADGFTRYGGLFTYNENHGKKLRKNDTITTNTDYYLLKISSQNLSINGLDILHCGNVSIKNLEYKIYKIKINNVDVNTFKQLENFFWHEFKLKLLYKKPEIIQLWPPASKYEDINYSIKLNNSINNIFCKVESDSPDTKVYSYLGQNYNEVQIYKDQYNNSICLPKLYNFLLPVTVNRKFFANTQFFQNLDTELEKDCFKISVNEDVYNIFSLDIHNNLIKFKEDSISLISDIPISIIKVTNKLELVFENVQYRECNDFIIENNITEVWIYSHSLNRMILRLRVNQNKKALVNSLITDEAILKKIKRFLNEETIPIPRKYCKIESNISKFRNTYKLLKGTLQLGKIQPNILKILIDEELL